MSFYYDMHRWNIHHGPNDINVIFIVNYMLMIVLTLMFNNIIVVNFSVKKYHCV